MTPREPAGWKRSSLTKKNMKDMKRRLSRQSTIIIGLDINDMQALKKKISKDEPSSPKMD